jgi:hypothetical protein
MQKGQLSSPLLFRAGCAVLSGFSLLLLASFDGTNRRVGARWKVRRGVVVSASR